MVIVYVLVASARSELHDSLKINVQGFELHPDDGLRHPHAEVLYQQAHATAFRERLGVETHILLSSRDRRTLTVAL
jgi:hypothetical protein